MTATYYPQAALTGFAQALSSKLGVNVQFATGQPRTDGSTVYLPTISQALTEGEFEALCGIAVHEAAHVYFGSCDRMAQYATDALKAQCFNAVLDVADETRIEGFVSSAQKLLAQSNLSASRRIVDTDALRKGDPVWAVLAAGILWVRIGRGAHYAPAKKHQHYGLMVKAYQILKKCRTRRAGRGPKRYRTRAQWFSLKSNADKLVDLLKALGDASGAPQGEFGVAGTGDGASDLANAHRTPGEMQGATTASEQEGADLCDPGSSPTPTYGGNGAGSGHQESPCRNHSMDQGVYSALRPALAGPIERMARCDDADGFAGGYLSGGRLGRNIEMAAIDGRCFDRRNSEGEKLHIAVLLDTSGSMFGRIAQVAAVAQAFADAVAHCATSVALATFASTVKPCGDFKTPPCHGSTQTHEALEWADKALSGHAGRLACVVITDGSPNSYDLTAQAAQALRSHGVQVIGVAYQTAPGMILETMPGAMIVAANDPMSLAAQLSRVAQQVAVG